jgi:hypothetical protein
MRQWRSVQSIIGATLIVLGVRFLDVIAFSVKVRRALRWLLQYEPQGEGGACISQGTDRWRRPLKRTPMAANQRLQEAPAGERRNGKNRNSITRPQSGQRMTQWTRLAERGNRHSMATTRTQCDALPELGVGPVPDPLPSFPLPLSEPMVPEVDPPALPPALVPVALPGPPDGLEVASPLLQPPRASMAARQSNADSERNRVCMACSSVWR